MKHSKFYYTVITMVTCISVYFLMNTTLLAKGVTIEQYKRIKNGMTQQDVFEILGRPQHKYSGAKKVGVSITRHAWNGDAFGSNVTIIFHDGKVFSKSQFGLKPEDPYVALRRKLKEKASGLRQVEINGLWKESGKRGYIIIAEDGTDIYINGYYTYNKQQVVWYGYGSRKDSSITFNLKFTSCPDNWVKTRSYQLTISKTGKYIKGTWNNSKGQTGKAKFYNVSPKTSGKEKKSTTKSKTSKTVSSKTKAKVADKKEDKKKKVQQTTKPKTESKKSSEKAKSDIDTGKKSDSDKKDKNLGKTDKKPVSDSEKKSSEKTTTTSTKKDIQK